MSNVFAKMALENPSYPIRMGQGWTDAEDKKLLSSIHNKKAIQLIADEHQRTVGGIQARQKNLATQYWFNNELPIEEIIKHTGLTKHQIENAIQKQEAMDELKNLKASPKKKNDILPDETIELLKHMNEKLDILIEITKERIKMKLD